MSREEEHDLTDLLADYLGGEMDRSARAAFESRLADDPALAGDVGGLRRTLAALRSLDEGEAEPARVSPPSGRRDAVWRYAAVIALAFLGGWGVRAMLNPAATPEVNGQWQERMLAAWNERPEASTLSRSLVALGRATGGG
jgi:anti-sigma factor RsiW